MKTPIESDLPPSLAEASFTPRGRVQPSPATWRDQVLYFLLPDRFSDGKEDARPLYDPAQAEKTSDPEGWATSGKIFQGGTLKGIESKLDYLQSLGITTLWIGPIWRRQDSETYHGYGIQNFLDVDPRFGIRQDLRDLVDAAHDHEPVDKEPYRHWPPSPYPRLVPQRRHLNSPIPAAAGY